MVRNKTVIGYAMTLVGIQTQVDIADVARIICPLSNMFSGARIICPLSNMFSGAPYALSLSGGLIRKMTRSEASVIKDLRPWRLWNLPQCTIVMQNLQNENLQIESVLISSGPCVNYVGINDCSLHKVIKYAFVPFSGSVREEISFAPLI